VTYTFWGPELDDLQFYFQDRIRLIKNDANSFPITDMLQNGKIPKHSLILLDDYQFLTHISAPREVKRDLLAAFSGAARHNSVRGAVYSRGC